jgi:hypothetical protein
MVGLRRSLGLRGRAGGLGLPRPGHQDRLGDAPGVGLRDMGQRPLIAPLDNLIDQVQE